MKEQILSKLKMLVSFKTITGDRQQTGKAFLWIQRQLNGLPLDLRTVSKNGFLSLVATTRKTKKPSIWLYAHIDVVGGSPLLFKPRVSGDKIYGRGVFDMKYAIACYLHLLQTLKEDLPKYDLGLMITSDEEQGGNNGCRYLLNKGYKGKFAIVPDGGSNWDMEKNAKGVWHLKISVRGVSGHASKPWQARNAIHELNSFIYHLLAKFPSEKSKNHNLKTISVGQIVGGKTINQIPDSAAALVDIRFMSLTEKKNIENDIQYLNKRYRNITVTELMSADSMAIDTENNLFKSFRKITKKIIGHNPRLISSSGASDARYFVNHGIPVVVVQPCGGGHHSEKEWVSISDLERFYQILKQFVILHGRCLPYRQSSGNSCIIKP